jgi:hypothetical protein
MPFAESLLVFAVLAVLFSLVGRRVYGAGDAGRMRCSARSWCWPNRS